jgi:2,3-bisphosphoglycerate-independent phosphoglycerate mutase
MPAKKVILIIMDGWGLGKVASADAIQNALVPFTNSLYSKYPHTTLITCGEAVGLPEGQMGNSEVGHLNIGAGRVVYQELQRINVAVRDGLLAKNEVLLQTIRHAKKINKPLHLLGLVSDGGVHSHISHLKAIVDLCKAEGLTDVFIHAFTDGRDCDPKSGLGFITNMQMHLNNSVGKIATVSGRYYAMDRDKRWERVKLAYDALVNGAGEKATDAIAAVENSYQKNITDEFILPTVILNEAQQPLATIRDGDVAICFNFRTDRCREISQVLTQTDLPEHHMQKLALHYTTMTEYDKTFKNVRVIFENDNLNNTLGEVLEQQGLKQIRAAETEKYPHVTTYDLKPEMSAYELTEMILPEINNQAADFMCINYANADMVGHTGVFAAAIKAVETVDACVEKLVTAALQNDYTVFLTADHGNADYMINEDGSPNTAHTLNPVPFFIIANDPAGAGKKGAIKPGKLADIAPTILTTMGLPIPNEMTGEVLIDKI